MASAFTPSVVSTATMPTSMTDAEATRLGLKSYSHGTTYTGSPNSPTISGPAGLSVTSSSFIPYQTSSGVWRLKVSFHANVTSGTSFIVYVAGTTMSTVYGSTWPALSAMCVGTAPYTGAAQAAYLSNRIEVFAATTSATIALNGEFELASKPTWAY